MLTDLGQKGGDLYLEAYRAASEDNKRGLGEDWAKKMAVNWVQEFVENGERIAFLFICSFILHFWLLVLIGFFGMQMCTHLYVAFI